METNKLTLSLMSAYWCSSLAAPLYADRYFWAEEQIDEVIRHQEPGFLVVLETLVKYAPSDELLGLLAAGPFEDYINMVIRKESAAEAAYVLNSSLLNPLLKFVLSDVEQLRVLARRDTEVSPEPSDPGVSPEFNILKKLNPKETAGFWCYLSLPYMANAPYEQYHQLVLSKLSDQEIRTMVIEDLLISAPDEASADYLRSDVLPHSDY